MPCEPSHREDDSHMHSRFDMHTQAVPLWEKKAVDEIHRDFQFHRVCEATTQLSRP
jgi:hypothetical protein